MPTDMPIDLSLTAPAPLSVYSLAVNLAIDAVLGLVLAWHFRRCGRTLSNRAVLAQTIPLISLTTVLIISVVKSSLALSLGLVGALSIVRFRTPIKEPEELAYLFLAIALGLGLGADQRVPTIVAFAIILAFLLIRSMRSPRTKSHNLYLNVEVPAPHSEGLTFDTLVRMIAQFVTVADLRRLDVGDGGLYATFYIDCPDDKALTGAMDSLKDNLPGASISFVDQEQGLGV